MASAKEKVEEDIKFRPIDTVAADSDLRARDNELEKRNKAMPEAYRDNPEKLYGWPLPEDRLPAVMPADKPSDHDYKQESYDKVDDELRDRELAAGTGTVARQELAKVIREAGPKLDMNEIQAPPSVNAQIAADGGGAQTDKIPTVDKATGEEVVLLPTGRTQVPVAPAAAESKSKTADNK